MEKYLSKKYDDTFVFTKIKYNFLSETYQGYAHPKDESNLVFKIEEDHFSTAGYSDNFPKVIWESELSSEIKEKIKQLFPALDLTSIKAQQIKGKEEEIDPNIQIYEEGKVSLLAISIPIEIKTNWNQVNQKNEMEKMKELSQYLQSVDFPVFVEVRYSNDERAENAKVFLITEEGEILQH
nr:hypothetical protein [Neobacillus sp. Marseille-Q6967]